MKKKMKQENKIEVVCWRFVEKQGEGEADSVKPILPIVKCVAGFVTKENKKGLEISSTKGTRGFIDTVKISKLSIVSRNEVFLDRKISKKLQKLIIASAIVYASIGFLI